MGEIKLFGKKTIRTIKKRLLAGETSTTIADDYGVSDGHIRKIRLGMKNPDHPNARWGYVLLTDAEEKEALMLKEQNTPNNTSSNIEHN